MNNPAQTDECVPRVTVGFPLFNAFNGQAIRLAVWPMELWLQWQADLLKAAAPATAEWLTRRREGTAAALETLERLGTCQDIKEVSRIQSEWVEDETKRLETDMRVLGGLSFLWPREAAKAGFSGGIKGTHRSH
jgi:hypothetical protein